MIEKCECLSWCRNYAENNQPAAHHRKCKKYIEESFYKVSANGSYCITDSLDGFDSDDYEISTVKMTRDQYENLPEFTGF